ncbi:MAG: insulinase family protein [Bacteroidia bacterium]|nr:insulinase family protein [Bacteroidia bacterium]MCX7764423.1 insulinase family protein [Bacteroidia bacterium]MDW8056710.1 insulinase family protein [Bacteroidia bacterium]
MQYLRWGALLWVLWAQTKLVYRDSVRQVYVYRLPNELTLIVSPNSASPRAFVMVATRAGGKNDPADNTGLAHYLEHMLFKGTDRYGTKDFDREKVYLDAVEALYEKYNKTKDSLQRLAIYKQIDSVSQLAAEWAIPNEYDRMVSALGAEGTNAFTTFDATAYINDVPSHQVERLLKLEAERFRRPVFRLFHTELEAVYEEKNIAIDNESRELSEKVSAALFPDHPYGTQTILGTIEHLKNPSLSAIKRFYETYYVPNNMAIIVAGDVVPQQVVEWVEKYWGSFQPKPIPPFPYQKGAPSPLRKRAFVEVIGPQSPYVQIAFRLPPDGTREAQIARVLDQILSNTVTGLLDEWLVQTHKVKSASSSLMLLSDHGAQYLYAEPKPGQSLEEVEKLLWQAVKRVQKGDFDEKLIEAAVNDLLFNEMKGWRGNSYRAYFLLDAFVKQKNWTEALYGTAKLRSLRKEELVAFARKYYTPKRCVVAYKRQGERPKLPKVPKPPITPLSIERGNSSSYTEAFLAEAREVSLPAPQFVAFDSALEKAAIQQKVPLYAIRNTDDSLFTLIWYLPLGSVHDKWIPLLMNYYDEVGPAGMSLESFKRRLFFLGARLSFYGGDRESYVRVEGISQNLPAIIALVDSLLHRPAVDEQAWAFLRENTLKDRADAKRSPGSIQGMLLAYGLYGPEHPRKNIPTESEMRQMTAAELARRAAELWRYPWEVYYDGPGGVAVAASLEKLLTVPQSWQAPPAPRLFSMQETPNKQVYFVHFPMVRAVLQWVHRSVPYRRELYPIAAYFTEYFGGGMSAVVFQEIRESKGLAYSANAYFATPSRPDLHHFFVGSISTQADKLIEAYDAMEALIDDLRVVPSLAELAQRGLMASLAAERIRHEGVFFSFWEARRFGLNRERRADLWEALPHLSAKDLTAFHETYLKHKPRLLLLMGDRERLPLEKLKEKGLQLRELSLEELFGY